MRSDALGFFWRDEPRMPKAKVERTPPEKVWERPDYLPGLEAALEFNTPRMEGDDLMIAARNQEILIFDSEVYPNFYCVAFISFTTGKSFDVWIKNDGTITEDQRGLLRYVFENFEIVGFNSRYYDMPLLAMFLAGRSCSQIKDASDSIIIENASSQDIYRLYKCKAIKANHVDLKEVAPLKASLKLYGGRMHCPRMQDLPFHPDTVLSDNQIAIVRWYCVNDLTNTAFLRATLREQMGLRELLTREYMLDLRSKSDAQIAESIIASGITVLRGGRPQVPQYEAGTQLSYRVPSGMYFRTGMMQELLSYIPQLKFVIGYNGKVEPPPELERIRVPIGDMEYQMGTGGLHSCEKRISIHSDEEGQLVSYDVASFYPFIILNLGLYPPHLGEAFLRVYGDIVYRRLHAKRSGNKKVADSLKITINGTFGKLGNPYSLIYAPNLMFQVTLSGQLYLLMLIERMSLAGIRVVSANTDGIVLYCPRHLKETMEKEVQTWEAETGFNTESELYRSYHARDVNNYIAVGYPDKEGKIKTKNKGAFARPGLQKNPETEVCIEAVEQFLTSGRPVEETIKACKDIRKFISVRTVRNGAVKVHDEGRVEYLGKAVRWYYAAAESGNIVVANSGYQVSRSEGAKPLMELPPEFPPDVDYHWYIQTANEILRLIGVADGECVEAGELEIEDD